MLSIVCYSGIELRWKFSARLEPPSIIVVVLAAQTAIATTIRILGKNLKASFKTLVFLRGYMPMTTLSKVILYFSFCYVVDTFGLILLCV